MKRIDVISNSGSLISAAYKSDAEYQGWINYCESNLLWGAVGSYSVQVTDATAELNQKRINLEAKDYLASTDWYIIRELDSGVPTPPEIKTERQLARDRIVE